MTCLPGKWQLREAQARDGTALTWIVESGNDLILREELGRRLLSKDLDSEHVNESFRIPPISYLRLALATL